LFLNCLINHSLTFSIIPGLTRENQNAQKVLADRDGFSVLMRAMQTDIEKLKIKAAFLLSSLCTDQPAFKGMSYLPSVRNVNKPLLSNFVTSKLDEIEKQEAHGPHRSPE
jgi:hypothetical protein